MSECVVSQLPLLSAIANANPRKRKEMLKSAKFDLIKSIVECIENILKGNFKIKKAILKKLKRYKTVLKKLCSAKAGWKRKKKVIIQSGGAFLPTLLAPIISVLAQRLIS